MMEYCVHVQNTESPTNKSIWEPLYGLPGHSHSDPLQTLQNHFFTNATPSKYHSYGVSNINIEIFMGKSFCEVLTNIKCLKFSKLYNSYYFISLAQPMGNKFSFFLLDHNSDIQQLQKNSKDLEGKGKGQINDHEAVWMVWKTYHILKYHCLYVCMGSALKCIYQNKWDFLCLDGLTYNMVSSIIQIS